MLNNSPKKEQITFRLRPQVLKDLRKEIPYYHTNVSNLLEYAIDEYKKDNSVIAIEIPSNLKKTKRKKSK